jgi:hypothetical protein
MENQRSHQSNFDWSGLSAHRLSQHSVFKPELFTKECAEFEIKVGRDPDSKSVNELYILADADRNRKDITAQASVPAWEYQSEGSHRPNPDTTWLKKISPVKPAKSV